MQKYRSLKETKNETCVALGFFDGLHRGHMAVISQMLNFANERKMPSIVFTFDAPPKSTLHGANIPYLVLPEEKERLFSKIGIDVLYSVPFSLVMHLEAEDFVKKILVEMLHAKHIFCGFNYHFGRGGNCGVEKLQELCKSYGITVHVALAVVSNGEPVSSTRIREFIKSGNINLANKMLGREFSYNFSVIHGMKFGRKISTPTINQNFPHNFIIPRFGAYASWAIIDGKAFWSVTNIGVGPTVSVNAKPHSETFVPEYFGGELYNKNVEVKLCEFLRDEQKFRTIKELRENITIDSKKAKLILSGCYLCNKK